MRDDAQRTAKYNAKSVATTVSLKVAALMPSMKTSFASKIPDFIATDIAIQSILNADGTIPLYQYSLYYNFGRELLAKQNRGVEAAALVADGTSLKTKYTSYGCVGATLSTIALDVFSIVIP